MLGIYRRAQPCRRSGMDLAAALPPPARSPAEEAAAVPMSEWQKARRVVRLWRAGAAAFRKPRNARREPDAALKLLLAPRARRAQAPCRRARPAREPAWQDRPPRSATACD